MRSAIIFCWCLLAVILGGFARAHADGIQIREASQVTSRGPLVVKAFLAEDARGWAKVVKDNQITVD